MAGKLGLQLLRTDNIKKAGASNVVPSEGQPVFDSTSKKLYVGDGGTPASALNTVVVEALHSTPKEGGHGYNASVEVSGAQVNLEATGGLNFTAPSILITDRNIYLGERSSFQLLIEDSSDSANNQFTLIDSDHPSDIILNYNPANDEQLHSGCGLSLPRLNVTSGAQISGGLTVTTGNLSISEGTLYSGTISSTGDISATSSGKKITGTKVISNTAPSANDEVVRYQDLATSSKQGLVRLGSDTKQDKQAQSVSSTQGRTYSIQFNNDNQLVVNVPWTDTVYSLPVANSSTLGGIKTGYTPNGNNFAVKNSGDGAYVNIPYNAYTTGNTFTGTNNFQDTFQINGGTISYDSSTSTFTI